MQNHKPNSARILLVDDFEMIRIMIRDGLKHLGFTRIDEAIDGVDAIAKIKDSVAKGDHYAFVFCDWNMPNKTGLEVVLECKSSEKLKHIPIVMVTANSEQEKVIQALKAGATDYIVKPIAPDMLQKKVAKILSLLNAA